jgi:DNA-binding response OmpR family regulator
MCRGLQAQGFEVHRSDNWQAALNGIVAGRYSLVLLEMGLFGPDEESALGKIMKARPQQKVIIVSSIVAIDHKVKCLEQGACDYLCKPFAVGELLARVRARLRGSPDQSGRFLNRNGMTLDLLKHRIQTGNGEVSLTEREFLVLEVLMKGAGKLFSRGELLAKAWDFGSDAESNVVDVYIRRLRNKVGVDVIETVRNGGYVFAA